MEVPVARQVSSIGVENFANKLQLASDAAANGQVQDSDAAEEAMKEFLQQAEEKLAGNAMAAMPVMTQTDDYYGDEEDEGHDDKTVTALAETYVSKNAKSFRQKALFAEKYEMDSQEAGNPFDMLMSMHEGIEQSEDNDQKQNDIKMFNTIVPIFESSRANPDLRMFMSDLFGGLQTYYNTKKRRKEIDEEMTILTKLYNEQEMKDAMEELQKKQAARLAAVASKGALAAEKKKADMVEPKTSKKAKTTGA